MNRIESQFLWFLLWLVALTGGSVLVLQGRQHIAALEDQLASARVQLNEKTGLNERQTSALSDIGQRYDELRSFVLQQASVIDSCSRRDHRPIVIVDTAGRPLSAQSHFQQGVQ